MILLLGLALPAPRKFSHLAKIGKSWGRGRRKYCYPQKILTAPNLVDKVCLLRVFTFSRRAYPMLA